MFTLTCQCNNTFSKPESSFEGKTFPASTVIQVQYFRPIQGGGKKLIPADIYAPSSWGTCSEWIGQNINLNVDVYPKKKGFGISIADDAKKPTQQSNGKPASVLAHK